MRRRTFLSLTVAPLVAACVPSMVKALKGGESAPLSGNGEVWQHAVEYKDRLYFMDGGLWYWSPSGGTVDLTDPKRSA